MKVYLAKTVTYGVMAFDYYAIRLDNGNDIGKNGTDSIMYDDIKLFLSEEEAEQYVLDVLTKDFLLRGLL